MLPAEMPPAPLLLLLCIGVYLSGLLFVFSIGVTPATPHAQIRCKMQNHIDPRTRPRSAAVYGFLSDSNLLLWNRRHHKAQGRRGSFKAHTGFKSFCFIYSFIFNTVGSSDCSSKHKCILPNVFAAGAQRVGRLRGRR